jgi:hypothetical protein
LVFGKEVGKSFGEFLKTLESFKGKTFSELEQIVLKAESSNELSSFFEHSVGVPDAGHENLRNHTARVVAEYKQLLQNKEFSSQLSEPQKEML